MVSPIKVHACTNVTKSATSFCVGSYVYSAVCLIKLVYKLYRTTALPSSFREKEILWQKLAVSFIALAGRILPNIILQQVILSPTPKLANNLKFLKHSNSVF